MYSIPFVILMGIGVVFTGLICIILLSMAMSAICRSMGDTVHAAPAAAAAAPAAPAAPAAAEIPNRQAMVAAIAAAIAEEMGTTPSGLRILSIKKL